MFLTSCPSARTAPVPVCLCACVYVLGSHAHLWADRVMYARVFRLVPFQFRRDVYLCLMRDSLEHRNSSFLRVQCMIHQARIIRNEGNYVSYAVNNLMEQVPLGSIVYALDAIA